MPFIIYMMVFEAFVVVLNYYGYSEVQSIIAAFFWPLTIVAAFFLVVKFNIEDYIYLDRYRKIS